MSAIPLARFLVEFGPEGDVGPLPLAGKRATADSAMGEVEARVAEALARGQMEGRAAAEAELQGKLETQRQEFELRVAAERRKWAEEHGRVLADCLAMATREAEARIAESVTCILQPLVNAQLQRQAVDELAALVRALWVQEVNPNLRICGPEDLITCLRERLAGIAANAQFTTSDVPEVQVTLNQTMIETRLGAWRRRLEEALA